LFNFLLRSSKSDFLEGLFFYEKNNNENVLVFIHLRKNINYNLI